MRARLLQVRDREAAVAHLAADPLHNLHLLEMASKLGARLPAGEVPPQLVGAFEAGRLVGVASLRPSLVLGDPIDGACLDSFLPYLEAVPSGLVKSAHEPVSALWQRLERRGRGALVDRVETAYAISRRAFEADGPKLDPPPGALLRRAEARDLEELVAAARASLREEGRPDPFDGDPAGFRRWVRGRLHRARVVEADGGVAFVAYADVRRPEGWLVQGVYTFPRARRSGHAAAGMAGLVAEAFAEGADHVQLAVVEGNHPAVGLYEKLGFEPFERLRTILFV